MAFIEKHEIHYMAELGQGQAQEISIVPVIFDEKQKRKVVYAMDII